MFHFFLLFFVSEIYIKFTVFWGFESDFTLSVYIREEEGEENQIACEVKGNTGFQMPFVSMKNNSAVWYNFFLLLPCSSGPQTRIVDFNE